MITRFTIKLEIRTRRHVYSDIFSLLKFAVLKVTIKVFTDFTTFHRFITYLIRLVSKNRRPFKFSSNLTFILTLFLSLMGRICPFSNHKLFYGGFINYKIGFPTKNNSISV